MVKWAAVTEGAQRAVVDGLIRKAKLAIVFAAGDRDPEVIEAVRRLVEPAKVEAVRRWYALTRAPAT